MASLAVDPELADLDDEGEHVEGNLKRAQNHHDHHRLVDSVVALRLAVAHLLLQLRLAEVEALADHEVDHDPQVKVKA